MNVFSKCCVSVIIIGLQRIRCRGSRGLVLVIIDIAKDVVAATNAGVYKYRYDNILAHRMTIDFVPIFQDTCNKQCVYLYEILTFLYYKKTRH
jgi:hypothetical protein